MLEYIGRGDDGEPIYRRRKVRVLHDEMHNETFLVDEYGREVYPEPPQPESDGDDECR